MIRDINERIRFWKAPKPSPEKKWIVTWILPKHLRFFKKSFSLLFLGWLCATSTCLQDRFAAHTAINAQKRPTSGAGVGLACRSCHHLGLRRWFLRVRFDEIAASLSGSPWQRGARHFVQNWAEVLVRCLCWSRLEWIGCKSPRSDNWHATDRKQRRTPKTKLTTAPDQLQNWSAQVGSLEYKNTWFSEEGGRNTLRFTKCSNGVSKTYLLFI